MMGKTHSKGGEVAALAGYLLLSRHGLLPSDIAGPVAFAVIYPMAIWGSTAPDLDHGYQSIPSKDVVSKSIWGVLHIGTLVRKKLNLKVNKTSVWTVFDARHRSWQTHSYEALLLWVFAVWLCMQPETFGGLGVTSTVLRLILTGIALGWAAHLFLDGITPEGIYIGTIALMNGFTKKSPLIDTVKIVPNVHWFSTGGPWENIWNHILSWEAVILLGIVVLGWLGIDAGYSAALGQINGDIVLCSVAFLGGVLNGIISNSQKKFK